MNNKLLNLLIFTILISLIPLPFFKIGAIDIDLFKTMLFVIGFIFLITVFVEGSSIIIPRDRHLLILLLLLSWFISSGFWAANIFLSISLAFVFSLFIILYIYLLLFVKQEKDIYKFVYFLPLTVLVVLLYDIRFLEIGAASSLREFGHGGSALIAALGLSSEISVLCILFIYIFSGKKIVKLYSVILLLFCGFSFIISGSRIGLLVFFFNVIVYLFVFVRSKLVSFREKTNLVKIVILMGLGYVLVFFIIGVLLPKSKELFIDRMLGSISPDLVDASVADYYWEQNARLKLWDAAIDMFKLNPLFGVGFGNFRTEITIIAPSLSYWTFTHNVYLTILSETGLVGITLWIFLIVGVIHRYYTTTRYLYKNRLKKEYFLVLAFAVTFFGLLVHCIFMPVLFKFPLYFYIAMSFISKDVFTRGMKVE